MQLKPGRKYETKSGHVFTAIEIVEEPGEGTQMLGTVLGPLGSQMEMYSMDGVYKKGIPTDWDLIKEIPQKKNDSVLMMEEPSEIYNRSGDALYLYIETRYFANHGVPKMIVTNAEVDADKYTQVRLLTDNQLKASEGN